MRWAEFILLLAGAVAQDRMPQSLPHQQPVYTEEARKALVNATATVRLVVGTDGIPKDVVIVRGPGFGLDENAVMAVREWRFTPAIKKGAPVEQIANVEVTFRLLNSKHENQFARLAFTLPPGVPRPQLIQGKIPDNPRGNDPYRLRIVLTAAADGRVKDIRVIEATLKEWGEAAAQLIGGWRFEPGREDVTGELELLRGMPASPIRRSPTTQVPAGPVDLALMAPHLLLPLDGTEFANPLRRTTLQWEPSPGAASYVVETAYDDGGEWHPYPAVEVKATSYTFNFIGAQAGRWRVWPVNINGAPGNPSEWRTFRYTR